MTTTSMSVAAAAGTEVTKPPVDDDPEAAVEPWPSPPGWEKKTKTTYHRALLVGGLMTLLLLSCLVLGRDSASAAWLQIDLAKLTSMNNNGTSDDAPHGHGRDELLGGLLPAGMDRRSCRSRYETWRYYKHFPYTASPHLLAKLRAYEARHRRCAPGTALYNQSVEHLRSSSSSSGNRSTTTEECRYVVWLPFDGLGNRMLSMVSGFLYALLTDRVLLAALPPDSVDLFCEPFPGATWLLPATADFPISNLVPRGQNMDRSYTRLLDARVLGPDVDTNATAPPPYAYASLGWQMKDPAFFCGEHQRVLGKVGWVLLYSDLYFAPSMYGVAAFQDELRRLFPEKESVSHLLSRYLFHPTNPVWSLVTRYYRSYLAPAKRRIGVQVRMFNYGTIPVDDMYRQILACSRQEHILPETADDDDGGAGGDDEEAAAATTGADSGSNSTAILVASLYADYYERLRARYYEHAAAGGERVAVFQPSHEERQATENMAHNQRALAEIFLLSFSEELLTSGRSTFGYVSSNLAGVRPAILLTAYGHRVPEPPCRRAVSMEPCNLTPPPRSLECREKPADEVDLARHLRVCEDSRDSVKFFD